MELPRSRRVLLAMLVLFGTTLLTGCQTLREVTNLRNVDFRIDRVSDTRLAGVNLDRVESFSDLGGMDVAKLGSALSRGELPLSFTLHVEATNPEDNSLDARLTAMDWTLFLQDRETVSGTFQQEIVMPPGTPTDVPLDVELDLVQFFDENLRGLVDLATAVGGEGPPTNVKLKVQPTIQTRLGPMRYPTPITVVSRDVGS